MAPKFPEIFRSLFEGLNSVRMGRNLGERIFRSVPSVRLVLPFPKSAHSPKSDIVCKICSQNSEATTKTVWRSGRTLFLVSPMFKRLHTT